MRFVDIALLQFPAGWQGRADQALADLRNEIAQADAAARAAGEDPAAARKAAIAAGLNRPARQQIWGDLKPHLSALSNGKCWYSESLNPTSDKNVDHFRPKGRVKKTRHMKAIGGSRLRTEFSLRKPVVQPAARRRRAWHQRRQVRPLSSACEWCQGETGRRRSPTGGPRTP